MNVCYFGSYDPYYSRNRIIKKGLKLNGSDIFECNFNGSILSRYTKLLISFFKNRSKFNSIIVGFPGHFDIPLAFILGKVFGKKVFYDIFASTYETYVLDRDIVNKHSLRAKFYYLVDWIGLKLADFVIVDTFAHGELYNKIYRLDKKKQVVVYVGSDVDYFYPRKVREETDVLFYGSYQPLQGTEVIIEAASKLPKVKFKMIGDGLSRRSTEDLAKKLNLKNVEFVNWLSLEKLATEITKAKISLGIFSKSEKANVVIPNKVYDALATQKAVISASTKAMTEIINSNPGSIILVDKDNSQKLAQKLEDLLGDSATRRKYAINGYKLYKRMFTPEKVVKNLYKNFNNE